MVIVGAGECGTRAAFALREHGFTGPVSLIGAEGHLPYERPPLSKQTVVQATEPAPKAIADAAHFSDAGITLMRTTKVDCIDRADRLLHLDGKGEIRYDRLLLATGAEPRRLTNVHKNRHCFYLRTFEDALALRPHFARQRRVAIIGGGFIGLELAASARSVGCTVTVIEAQPRILMRGVPADIAAVVQDRHEMQGVRIVCGQNIVAIDEMKDDVDISLANGETIAADLAVIGIGATPNTELARMAGLEIENGIKVDSYMQSSDPNIFAAGDCCSFPLAIYGGRRVRLEAWRNAREQGALAARNMLGARESHTAVPWFWSDQYDLGLQIAGLPDEGTHIVRRDMGAGVFLLFHLADNGRLVAASGIGPGNAVAKDIRLAEMLIAGRASPTCEELADSAVNLKALLRRRQSG